MTLKYKIADFTVAVNVVDHRYWDGIESHYTPFATDDGNIDLDVTLTNTSRAPLDDGGYTLVYSDDNCLPGAVRTDFWKDAHGNLKFSIQSPYSATTDAYLYIDHTLSHATMVMAGEPRVPVGESVVTCAMQLAYMVGGAHRHRLMSHSSCVVVDGIAYMFIGKSGTGKSTHSRQWLSAIPDTFLLNDDHPIVHITDDGAVAYGSPWSGKTHCYVNAQAPLAAIVRIKQAPNNVLHRLHPIEAYASLIASFSGLTMIPQFADSRHADIEALVNHVPCYRMDCLPNPDAAVVCHQGLKNDVDNM